MSDAKTIEAGTGQKFIDCYNLFVGSAWRDHGLTPYELSVLFNLASRADHNRKCFPSSGTLAKECLMSRPQVFKALNGLKLKGYLTWDRRIDGVGQHSNEYLLLDHPGLTFILAAAGIEGGHMVNTPGEEGGHIVYRGGGHMVNTPGEGGHIVYTRVSTTDTHKVKPIEEGERGTRDLPSVAKCILSPSLNHQDLKDALQLWINHMAHTKELAFSQPALNNLVARCERWGRAKSIRAINESIEASARMVREPFDNQSQRKKDDTSKCW